MIRCGIRYIIQLSHLCRRVYIKLLAVSFSQYSCHSALSCQNGRNIKDFLLTGDTFELACPQWFEIE